MAQASYERTNSNPTLNWSFLLDLDRGNKFALLALTSAPVIYIATTVFTNYNPVATTCFAMGALVGRVILAEHFHDRYSKTFTRIFGAMINFAIAIIAATGGARSLQEGLNFVISALPSRPESVSALFAEISKTFASFSDPTKALSFEQRTAIIPYACLTFLTFIYIGRVISRRRQENF